MLSKEIDVKMCTDERDIYVNIGRYPGQDPTQWTSLKKAIKHADSAFN